MHFKVNITVPDGDKQTTHWIGQLQARIVGQIYQAIIRQGIAHQMIIGDHVQMTSCVVAEEVVE